MLSSPARAKDRCKREETVITIEGKTWSPSDSEKKQGLNNHKYNDASGKHLEEKHHSKIY